MLWSREQKAGEHSGGFIRSYTPTDLSVRTSGVTGHEALYQEVLSKWVLVSLVGHSWLFVQSDMPCCASER